MDILRKVWYMFGSQGDAQDSIREQTSLDSFVAGFELAWRLSIELHNDENERSFSCRTRRTGAHCVWEDEI